MALIGTSVEPGGVVRMFFDLREMTPRTDDRPRIARTMQQAFALTEATSAAPEPATA